MIVCCGEALIDMLPRESTAGEPAFAPYAGGALFNSAIALGRLGAPVEFFSGLSSDLFGQQIRETLASSKVGSRYADISARPTTLAFVRLTDGHATYTFYDENTAGRMLSEADLPSFDADIDAMLFGAISLIPEPCGSAYEALMKREHEYRVVMLDPNIRPGFIQDKDKHLARMERMIQLADIVKLSEDDLTWFGETGSPAETAAKWLGLGPKLVIVTGGSKGATGYTKDHKISVASGQVTVVDTVGAGDTFNAGVLASLHDQHLLSKEAIGKLSETQIHRALTLGAKAAAITVSRAGANPPWRREID
ncbi:carbohydrate kinase [Mesorhizobium sp. BAC0120]|uniref:carbohydrate kinase family protein n=1 Tax=Mesorhizobium sp. BAC0120 TaxID=3090670 RepID=UPI00298C0628|nr:carbohydrate kinase [Mesorhizobium sp. BAC0120]MDW6020979.1 carbohydrate kinase [Mesorhizobium sp. BAC0120]